MTSITAQLRTLVERLPDELPRPDSDVIQEMARLISADLGLSPAQSLVAIGIWGQLAENRVAEWLGKSSASVHAHLGFVREKCRNRGSRGNLGLALLIDRAVRSAVIMKPGR